MRSIIPDLSQRYMLAPAIKPIVVNLFEQLRIASGDTFSEAQLLSYWDSGGRFQLPASREAAWAVGICMAACSTGRELLEWARTPDVAKSILDANVENGRCMADLDAPYARERYERVISRQFSKESDWRDCGPELEVSCEGCLDESIRLDVDGTVHCSLVGTVCLFEHLPVTDNGRRVPLCFDCAIEGHAIRSAGFSPLHLEEFRVALEEMKEARHLDGDNNDLYENGASVPFYEAAMRRRRDRIKARVVLEKAVGRLGEVLR